MDMLLRYLVENGIGNDLAKGVLQHFQQKEYKKGSTILDMGENTFVVCFIIKGIARGYYINDNGQDITKCFSAENSWCCIYNMLHDTPSEFWIEALEDCILAEISVDKLRKVLSSNIEFQALFAKSCCEAFMDTDEKGVCFQRVQAKERYLRFLELYPNLEKRIKQEYIASYIGITPTSLSRIKRNL